MNSILKEIEDNQQDKIVFKQKLEKAEQIALSNLNEQIQKNLMPFDQDINELVKNDQKNGISLIDVKINLLLSYYQLTQLYSLYKLQGKSIKDSKMILKIIYIRTLLNKLKPIEKKLEYQIEKQLRQGQQQDDPLSLQPKPQTMAQTLEKETAKQGDVYRPPKIAPQQSREDRQVDKKKKDQERKREHLLKQPFLNEFEEEISDNPIYKRMNEHQKQLTREEKERERYEEDNFIRLPMSKKDKIRIKKQKASNKFDTNDIGNTNNIKELLNAQGLASYDQKEFKPKKKVKREDNVDLQEFGKKNRNKKFKKK